MARGASHLVFVYGSLMRGMRHHDVLAGAAFVRADATVGWFDLVDLGAWPGAVEPGQASVQGEVYRVDAPGLTTLDRFEGCPDLYVRRRVDLAETGEAWMYVFRRDRLPGRPGEDLPVVPGGCWRRWLVG
ncbi:MAG: gamma-glutamylcyclotransferase family protein [Myxococcota bacterium]